MSVPTNVYTGIAKYPLLAIPVFILAGMIFERAGVAARLVRFARARSSATRRGGLAIVADPGRAWCWAASPAPARRMRRRSPR